MAKTEKTSLEKVVALCKSRGIIFPGSEIYGGLANTWDYGPLGVEIKNNIKRAWWKKFIQESPYNVGLDAAILMIQLPGWLPATLEDFPIPSWTARNARPGSGLINLSKIT